ncbi:MAG: hypothetical protein ACOYNB_13120 [Aquabacterium sp.]|uniref:hypothetical protein n=1 Tax=Aquabacterium sp. TaxID=1872578 RepID=UPI003BDCCE75
MRIDAQTVLTALLVMGALAFLARKWWPMLRSLVAGQPAAGCGASAAQASTCGNGCGSCGSASASRKDHRVNVVRRPR